MSSMSPQEEWCLHKNTIHRLYIVEDRPLKEVMATLRGQGFRQTKTNYEQQLKTWGFFKNLKSGEWKAIGHKAEKRKRQNKDSDVAVSGTRYPPAKVRKETSRHFYNTQEKLQHEAMSPETHSAVTVCTPAPIDMSFPWPSSLPWLQLTESAPVFRPGQLSAFPGLAICTQEAPGPNSSEGVHQKTTIEKDELLPLVIGTQGFSNLDSSSYNVSTMAAELGKAMPESFEGEHFLTSHIILKERGIIPASTLLRILAYRFSNNLIETRHTGVLDFIRRSGVIDPEILTKELILAQPTIGAFFEKVFERAIETRQIDIVMKALDVGKDPSLRGSSLLYYTISVGTYGSSLPVLVEMLLLAGAKVHMEPAPSHVQQCRSLLVKLIANRNMFGPENLTKLAQLFVSKGFPTKQHCCECHGSALQVAAATGSVALVKSLDILGPHPLKVPSNETWDYRGMIFSALGNLRVAEACGMVQYLLSRYSTESDEAKLRLGPPLDLNILLRATNLGNKAIVRLCHAMGVDIDGEDYLGRFPLALAATSDSKMLVEELLSLGVHADERAVVDGCTGFDSAVIAPDREQELTALEVAVRREMAGAVALLLKFGATVTEDVLRIAVKLGRHSILHMLVEQTASITEDVLNLAVKLGNRSMVQMLVEQGAPITDAVFERALETFYAVPTAPSISRYLAMITGSSDIQSGYSRHALVIKQAGINMSRTLLAAVQLNDHLLVSDLVGTELSFPVHPPDDGYSILREAILNNNYWTVDLFLQAYPTAYDSRSLLNVVAKCIDTPWREKRLEIVKELLDRRQLGTLPDHLEATAVNIAVDLAEERDHTLLDLMLHLFAVERGNLQIIRLLLDAGAAVNAPPSQRFGATALQLAAIKGYIGIARLLISLGANINAPGAKYGGRTALEGAAEHGRLDLVQLLLEEGALVEGMGRKQFIRAVGYACKQDHQVLANLLKSWGGWSEIDEHALAQEDLTDPNQLIIIENLPHILMGEDDYESCDEPAGDFESDEDE
ncbi:hypothetical protein DL768_006235 [Monosporascus sp. mg162]|nr:hypothetical protein DL768_006235 [Monosporascus sp. mg162]